MATAKDNTAQTMTKKDFILQQPKEMRAKEVVEKAAAQGFELREKHVHVVRSAVKTKPKGKSSKRTAKRAKSPAPKAKGRVKNKAPNPRAAKGVSKSELIRKLPPDLSAREVVAKAAAQGIEMTDKYVYVIRSAAKARKSKAAKSTPKSKASVATRKAIVSQPGDDKLQALLRQAIADCGLVRSREILAEVESAFAGG